MFETQRRENPVVEHGILFSSEMIRSILEGTKRVTRRVVNTKTLRVLLKQPVSNEEDLAFVPELMTVPAGIHRARLNAAGAVTLSDYDFGVKPGEFRFRCPYADGVTQLADFPNRSGNGWRSCWQIQPYVGQRLWVRETWRQDRSGRVRYRADGEPRGRARWKPAIHMPRKHARIVLDVEAIRIERLSAIDEGDARLEGVKPFFEQFPGIGPDQCITTGELARDEPYRASYACLWDEINGDRGHLWKSNPWVWVIHFAMLPKDPS